MKATMLRWTPALLMGLGALFTVGIDTQRSMELRAPLGETVPERIAGYRGEDLIIPAGQRRVAGMSEYVMRVYRTASAEPPAAGYRFSLYIGYYQSQTNGQTIHSPKNCLPGAGWKPLKSGTTTIQTARGPETVNRYLLQRDDQQALVLYWYQGRGRIEANEYVVKWDLLRDAALKGRTEEALVRIVVPIRESRTEALRLASDVATTLTAAVRVALPATGDAPVYTKNNGASERDHTSQSTT